MKARRPSLPAACLWGLWLEAKRTQTDDNLGCKRRSGVKKARKEALAEAMADKSINGRKEKTVGEANVP